MTTVQNEESQKVTAAPSESDPQPGDGAVDSEDEQDAWRRPFRLLLSGSVLSQLGTLGAAAANPLLALALTGSPIVAGWVAAASTLPGLFLHLPAGLLVDRSDRWLIMLVSQVIRVVNSIALVVCLCVVAAPWPILVVAAVIDGSCAVFFRIAELATVRFVVPDGKAENAMGKSEARHHVALVLGRPVGGALFALGRTFPYILDALTSLISAVSLLFLRNRLRLLESQRKKSLEMSEVGESGSLAEGFKWIFRDRFLSSSLSVCAIANIGFQIIILLLVVEAERKGLSGSVIGMMLATSGVSGFLGAITAPAMVRFLAPAATVKYCVALWVPLLLIVAIYSDPLVGMCAWGACSFMGAYINVALAVHQGRVIPRRVLGRVEGVSQFMTTGAVTIGAFAGGYVIATLGTRVTAALVAAAFAAIGIAVLVLVRNPGRDRGRSHVTAVCAATGFAVVVLFRDPVRHRGWSPVAEGVRVMGERVPGMVHGDVLYGSAQRSALRLPYSSGAVHTVSGDAMRRPILVASDLTGGHLLGTYCGGSLSASNMTGILFGHPSVGGGTFDHVVECRRSASARRGDTAHRRDERPAGACRPPVGAGA
ncbi:MFS transporter [Actinomadura welshii]